MRGKLNMKNIFEKNIDDTKGICHEVLVSIRQVIQAIDLHSRYLLRNYGLSGPQLVILQELSKQGEASIGELAKAISLGQATVTGILTRLEMRGLVTRRRCPKDKRRVLITVTEACERLLQFAPPPIQETFMEQFSRLLDWEQTMILSSLQRLVSMMDADRLETAPILAAGSIGETSKPIQISE
jgi:DNA-binding MarR family transcriptional regulator